MMTIVSPVFGKLYFNPMNYSKSIRLLYYVFVFVFTVLFFILPLTIDVFVIHRINFSVPRSVCSFFFFQLDPEDMDIPFLETPKDKQAQWLVEVSTVNATSRLGFALYQSGLLMLPPRATVSLRPLRHAALARGGTDALFN
jgi:hypothetical protein